MTTDLDNPDFLYSCFPSLSSRILPPLCSALTFHLICHLSHDNFHVPLRYSTFFSVWHHFPSDNHLLLITFYLFIFGITVFLNLLEFILAFYTVYFFNVWYVGGMYAYVHVCTYVCACESQRLMTDVFLYQFPP